MSKTITLDPARAKALCVMARQVIDKFTESITTIRSLTTDLDGSLSGGQGEVIKGTIVTMSTALTKLQDAIQSLNMKISQKERAIAEMETSTGKYANVDQIISEAKTKAMAAAAAK